MPNSLLPATTGTSALQLFVTYFRGNSQAHWWGAEFWGTFPNPALFEHKSALGFGEALVFMFPSSFLKSKNIAWLGAILEMVWRIVCIDLLCFCGMTLLWGTVVIKKLAFVFVFVLVFALVFVLAFVFVFLSSNLFRVVTREAVCASGWGKIGHPRLGNASLQTQWVPSGPWWHPSDPSYAVDPQFRWPICALMGPSHGTTHADADEPQMAPSRPCVANASEWVLPHVVVWSFSGLWSLRFGVIC